MPTVLSIAGLAHVGLAREINEDSFLISELGGALRCGPPEEGDPQRSPRAPGAPGPSAPDRRLDEVVERLCSDEGFVLGVYDGAGGHGGGDAASAVAAKAVAAALTGSKDGVELGDRLAGAVRAADAAILDLARADLRLRGMGSTATLAAVAGDRIFVAQIGDSRAYVLRRRTLVQVTRDDTLLQEALRTGSLEPRDAADFPHGNVLLQALGAGVPLKVAVTALPARRGDVLLLCTDGVHGLLDAGVLRAALLRHREPGVALRVLVDEALRAGGNDNIALVVARLDGEGLEPPDAADVLEDRGFHPPR
jgi:protein phosphatase